MINRILEYRKVARAYREFFRTPQGEIVLKDLMRTARMFNDTGVLSADELRQVEGARNLVRRVLYLARASEADIERMISQPVVNNEE